MSRPSCSKEPQNSVHVHVSKDSPMLATILRAYKDTALEKNDGFLFQPCSTRTIDATNPASISISFARSGHLSAELPAIYIQTSPPTALCGRVEAVLVRPQSFECAAPAAPAGRDCVHTRADLYVLPSWAVLFGQLIWHARARARRGREHASRRPGRGGVACAHYHI